MIRRIWLILACLCLASIAHATAFSGFRVDDLDYGGVALRWNVAGSTFSQVVSVDAGTSTVMTHDIADSTATLADGHYFRTFYSALGNDTWYYLITFGSNTFTCSNDCGGGFCDSGDDLLFSDDNGVNEDANSGFRCGGDGEPPYVVHPASATVSPTAPVHATADPYALFDGDGETVVDVETNCANLKADFATQSSQGSAGQVLLLSVTDYAQPCRMSSWSPTGHDWDYVVIQPKLDHSLYITTGARASIAHSSAILILEHDEPHQRESLGAAQFVAASSNTIWRHLWLRDPPGVYEPTQYTVTEATAANRQITIAEGCPTPTLVFKGLMLNLPGFTEYPGFAVVQSCSGGVVTFTSTSGTFTGTLSGNGTATLGSHVPISSCTATDPITCTTTMPHGLPDPATATVQQDFLYVGEVNGLNASGTWKYAIVDSDTISLIGTVGSTDTFTTSPRAFVRYGSMARRALFTANGNDNVWVLQSIVGTPWYGQFQAAHSMGFGRNGDEYPTNVGFRDGFFIGGSQGFPLDPDTGLPERWYTGTTGLDAFRLDGCRDCQFINIGIAGGMTTGHFNAQNTSDQPSDITIRAVEAVVMKRHFTGDYFEPYSYGLYQSDPRQCTEWKGGVERLRMYGLTCHGAATGLEFNSTGYSHFFSNTVQDDQDTETRHIEDVDVQWGTTEGVAAPFGLGVQIGGLLKNQGINKRFRWNNNFHYGDYIHTRITPQSAGITGTAAENSGYQFTSRMGVSGFQAKNNTSWYSNGTSAELILVYGGDRIPRCEIESNIFPYFGGSAVINTIAGTPFTPLDTTSFQTRFDSFCPGGSFRNNLVLRGVEDPSDIPTQETETADSSNKTAAEWAAAWATTGSFDGVTPGPDATTFAGRHDALFDGSMTPVVAFSSFGITSYDTHRRMRGKIVADADSVTQVSPTALRFSWNAPYRWTPDPGVSPCTVRLSDNDFTEDALSQTASGDSFEQTVTFNGLTPGGTYSAFLECPDGESLYWKGTLL